MRCFVGRMVVGGIHDIATVSGSATVKCRTLTYGLTESIFEASLTFSPTLVTPKQVHFLFKLDNTLDTSIAESW